MYVDIGVHHNGRYQIWHTNYCWLKIIFREQLHKMGEEISRSDMQGLIFNLEMNYSNVA